MRAELRALLAIAQKELRMLRRYPLNAAQVVILPIVQGVIPGVLLGATFLVGGRALGLQQTAGTQDVAGFLFLGAIATIFTFAAFWFVAFAFRLEMNAGTLEPAWLTPTRRETFVAGYALAGMLQCALGAVALLGIGVALFGARYLALVAVALPALLLSWIALVGVAYLMSSVTLLVKEPNTVVDIASFLFSALAGGSFPLTVLPWAVRWLSFLIPTTYGLDLLRVFALGTRPLLPPVYEYLVLLGLTAAFIPLGIWVYRLTERRLTRTGAVGQH